MKRFVIDHDDDVIDLGVQGFCLEHGNIVAGKDEYGRTVLMRYGNNGISFEIAELQSCNDPPTISNRSSEEAIRSYIRANYKRRLYLFDTEFAFAAWLVRQQKEC